MFTDYNKWCEWYHNLLTFDKDGIKNYVSATWNGSFMEYDWSWRAAELFKYPRVPLKKGDEDVTVAQSIRMERNL